MLKNSILPRIFAGFVALVFSASGALSASLALVVGNDSYVEVPKLQKARSDSKGYEALLKARGFDVTRIEDADGRRMRIELAKFYDRIRPGDTVAFIFSGHGWSDGTENFLMPTDIPGGGSATLVAAESFPLRNGANGIIDQIHRRGPGLTVAVIDACRDNPFPQDSQTRSVGLSRGLARVSAPAGTFIAFSAGEGQTALDRLSNGDTDQYSVFTRHFLAELSKAQDLQTAFKATQSAVNRDAQSIGHPQRPAYYDEVIGTACLSNGCSDVVPVTVIVPTPDPAPAVRNLPSAAEEWQDFKDSESIAALTIFADRHPGTAYAELARERIKKLSKATETVEQAKIEVPRPSWCPRAGTATEKAICKSDQLAAFDTKLNALYSVKKAGLSGSAEKKFVRQQKAWLGLRDTCEGDESCLIDTYKARILTLE